MKTERKNCNKSRKIIYLDTVKRYETTGALNRMPFLYTNNLGNNITIILQVWIGFPILYFIIGVFLMVFPVIRQPWQALAAFVVLATGLPVYYFILHRKERPKILKRIMGKKLIKGVYRVWIELGWGYKRCLV